MAVNSVGYANPNGYDVDFSSSGVCPALHFNLSSSSLKKVGTVAAKEDSLTGGTSGGVTYDPPELFGEFDPEPEQPSKPSDPSGGGSSGTPSGSQGQTGKGGASGGSVTQGQGSTGSQNGTQAGEEKDKKLAKKKTWYFRVCAISAGGKKGTWSKVIKVKVKK